MASEPIVYVIDDDDGVRGSLEFLLDCAGLRVRGFASADAFLKASPPLDGACVVTGHADVPLAIQAMKAGAVDFIEKPFDDEVILSAIRRAISDRAADADARAERNAIAGRIATLSTRERQIMDRLVEGQANKAIAFDLGISARTVEVYRANAMMKMQAKTLSDLVRMATIARVGGV